MRSLTIGDEENLGGVLFTPGLRDSNSLFSEVSRRIKSMALDENAEKNLLLFCGVKAPFFPERKPT